MAQSDALMDRCITGDPSRSSASNSRQKTVEFLGGSNRISLGFLFRSFGMFIGNCPYALLIASAIILMLGSGLYDLRLRDNVRDGYTPRNSQSRKENLIYRNFLGSDGDPVMTTVLIVARDGGSMHRIEYMEEAVKQWKYISTEMIADLGNNKTLKFSDFCGHYCNSNTALQYFTDVYKMKSKDPSLDKYILSYPISTLTGFKLHMERNLFGVETTDNTNITNMKYVKLVALSVLSEVKSLDDFEEVGKWEMELFEFCRNYTSHPQHLLDIYVIGAEIVDTEINKDGQKMTPYFILGFALMLAFVIATVRLSAFYYGYRGRNIWFVGIFCAMVPIFSIICSLGLNNLIGNRTNSPLLIMPFLVMGIGVNDAFLIFHSWIRTSAELSKNERLALVLQEVGPSITTTTLTNVISFIFGVLSPTEEMSIFSFGSAVALFFAYLFSIIFFCPIIVLTVDKPTDPPVSSMKRVLKNALKSYAKLISDSRVFLLLILGAIVYWSFGALGTYNIEARLDTAKILPLDTPIRKPNRLIEEYVWNEFYPVTVIVNSPLNISDEQQMSIFNKMVHDYETIPKCRGSEFSISWIRDYQEYFFNIAAEDFDYDSETIQNTSTEFNYSKLGGFLKNQVYAHHAASLVLNQSFISIPVRKFSLTFVYHNITSWDDRIEIMEKWRQIAAAYKSLNVSVWNVNSMFVDQMLNSKPYAYQNFAATIFCMLAVCAIFIQNPTSVTIAIFGILSISLGVTGYLSFWELDLDPVTLCAVLVSIGMAVDFVAHTTYHFHVGYKEKMVNGKLKRIPQNTTVMRLANTISNVGWPMFQSGFSTILCVLPLATQKNYLPLVFIKTITLVVIWGLFHGLVLIPVILAQIPLRFFNSDCNSLIFDTSSSNTIGSGSDEEEEEEMKPLSTRL